MLREFKEFVARGNLVDLAVAFVLGVAFAAVVTSFTDVVLGAISYVLGGDVSFDQLAVRRDGQVVIPYGAFLTALVSFLLIAFVLFLVVKAYNRFRAQEAAAPTETELLTEIRDELRRR
jgi:large conductance mechanosensitive channel